MPAPTQDKATSQRNVVVVILNLFDSKRLYPPRSGLEARQKKDISFIFLFLTDYIHSSSSYIPACVHITKEDLHRREKEDERACIALHSFPITLHLSLPFSLLHYFNLHPSCPNICNLQTALLQRHTGYPRTLPIILQLYLTVPPPFRRRNINGWTTQFKSQFELQDRLGMP